MENGQTDLIGIWEYVLHQLEKAEESINKIRKEEEERWRIFLEKNDEKSQEKYHELVECMKKEGGEAEKVMSRLLELSKYNIEIIKYFRIRNKIKDEKKYAD